MSFRNALFEQLKDNAGVAAIVSTRIYNSVAPEGSALPFIVLEQIGGDRDHHTGGANGLTRREFQITSYDDKPNDAETLAEAIRDALDGFRGTMGTTDTENVRGSFLSSSLDKFEPAADSKHAKSVYGVDQSWTFWHTSTVPSL